MRLRLCKTVRILWRLDAMMFHHLAPCWLKYWRQSGQTTRGDMGVSRANFSRGIHLTHRFEWKTMRTWWNDVILVNLCRILHKLINLCRILHKLTKMTSFHHVLIVFHSNRWVRWIPREKLALETPISPRVVWPDCLQYFNQHGAKWWNIIASNRHRILTVLQSRNLIFKHYELNGLTCFEITHHPITKGLWK